MLGKDDVRIDRNTTTPVFSSVCFDYLANRAAPDVILSAFLIPSKNAKYSSDNIFKTIHNVLSKNPDAIMSDSTTQVKFDPQKPFLTSDKGTLFTSRYYQYIGSLAHPPCSTNVQRILFT